MQGRDGFFPEESDGARRWHWCGAKGTLALTNPSGHPRRATFRCLLGTYTPGPAHLRIDGAGLGEDLAVAPGMMPFEKEMVLPPGTHQVRFRCTAAPAQLHGRTLVFALYDPVLEAR